MGRVDEGEAMSNSPADESGSRPTSSAKSRRSLSEKGVFRPLAEGMFELELGGVSNALSDRKLLLFPKSLEFYKSSRDSRTPFRSDSVPIKDIEQVTQFDGGMELKFRGGLEMTLWGPQSDGQDLDHWIECFKEVLEDGEQGVSTLIPQNDDNSRRAAKVANEEENEEKDAAADALHDEGRSSPAAVAAAAARPRPGEDPVGDGASVGSGRVRGPRKTEPAISPRVDRSRGKHGGSAALQGGGPRSPRTNTGRATSGSLIVSNPEEEAIIGRMLSQPEVELTAPSVARRLINASTCPDLSSPTSLPASLGSGAEQKGSSTEVLPSTGLTMSAVKTLEEWLLSVKEEVVCMGFLGFQHEGGMLVQFAVLFRDRLDSWNRSPCYGHLHVADARLELRHLHRVDVCGEGLVIMHKMRRLGIHAGSANEAKAWAAALEACAAPIRGKGLGSKASKQQGAASGLAGGPGLPSGCPASRLQAERERERQLQLEQERERERERELQRQQEEERQRQEEQAWREEQQRLLRLHEEQPLQQSKHRRGHTHGHGSPAQGHRSMQGARSAPGGGRQQQPSAQSKPQQQQPPRSPRQMTRPGAQPLQPPPQSLQPPPQSLQPPQGPPLKLKLQPQPITGGSKKQDRTPSTSVGDEGLSPPASPTPPSPKSTQKSGYPQMTPPRLMRPTNWDGASTSSPGPGPAPAPPQSSLVQPSGGKSVPGSSEKSRLFQPRCSWPVAKPGLHK